MGKEDKHIYAHGCNCDYCREMRDKGGPPILASDMTLRDYFAGQYIASNKTLSTVECYDRADKMMEARKK